MNLFRERADKEAKTVKDPYVALDRLQALYLSFDSGERTMADQVLAEWVLSEDIGVRDIAKALIDDLKINSAIPALEALVARLSLVGKQTAVDETEIVQGIIGRLKDA